MKITIEIEPEEFATLAKEMQKGSGEVMQNMMGQFQKTLLNTYAEMMANGGLFSGKSGSKTKSD